MVGDQEPTRRVTIDQATQDELAIQETCRFMDAPAQLVPVDDHGMAAFTVPAEYNHGVAKPNRLDAGLLADVHDFGYKPRSCLLLWMAPDYRGSDGRQIHFHEQAAHQLADAMNRRFSTAFDGFNLPSPVKGAASLMVFTSPDAINAAQCKALAGLSVSAIQARAEGKGRTPG